MSAIYHPNILHNYESARRFLSGESQIRELSQCARIPYPDSSNSYRSFVYYKEKILYPLTYITCLFLRIISLLTEVLGFICLSRWTFLKAQHLEYDYRDSCYRNFIYIRNTQRIYTSDFYAERSCPVSSITDPRMRRATSLETGRQECERRRVQLTQELQIIRSCLTTVSSDSVCFPMLTRSNAEKSQEFACPPRTLNAIETFYSNLQFYHAKGACAGIVYWFNYLYLKTQHLFTDPWDHAHYVAKLFEKGAPREASLLQTLSARFNSDPALRDPYEHLIDMRRVDVQSITLLRNVDLTASLREQIINLQPGVYKLGIPKHACSFIKISDGLFFIMDPNLGLVPCRGEAGFRNISLILNAYRENLATFKIYFLRQELAAS